jgi:hypothetical protein
MEIGVTYLNARTIWCSVEFDNAEVLGQLRPNKTATISSLAKYVGPNLRQEIQ